MTARDAIRDCLLTLDAPRARAVWHATMAHLPAPASDAEMLATLHAMRTDADRNFIPQSMALYSHHWLTERGLQSLLPDRLKPSYARLYPKKVAAVGIALAGRSGPEACGMIQGAMQCAVMECFGDDDTDTAIVKPHMMRARFRERRALLLPIPDDIPANWRP